MDDYLFSSQVRSCKSVIEKTHYLEILNHLNAPYDSVEEHPLSVQDDFYNFLHRKGAFSIRKDLEFKNGLRLLLQRNAVHPETFSPHVISFTHDEYDDMIRALHLPFRAIEATSVVGPFFWCGFDRNAADPHFQIVFRKSDVRKKGMTRGWEMMLSHSARDGITTGYVKGTASSYIVEAIGHLKSCAGDISHPFLLPMIVLSHELSSKNDQKQREARDWLRRLENALSLRNEITQSESYLNSSFLDIDAISRDLAECHSQVLWKRPQAWHKIVCRLEAAMESFWDHLPPEKQQELSALHLSMLSRLDFFKAKLEGIENYAHTTLERLNIQRSVLRDIIGQKESRLNLEIAGESRRLAHAGKRDSQSMKTLTLLGSIFLPGTYLASLFSMTFFNFQSDFASSVSPHLWIYFVVAMPVTAIVVGLWWRWDRVQNRRFSHESEDLEKAIDQMEAQIMSTMRQRTTSSQRPWTGMG